MSNLGMAIVHQCEQGVVFRLGKLRGVREPGWRTSCGLRTVTMPIPSSR